MTAGAGMPEGVAHDGEMERLKRAVVGSEAAIELLRFFEGNRYAMLSLDDLSGRLLRDPDVIRACVDTLLRLGFLSAQGKTPVIILTRDAALLHAVEQLTRLAQTPDGRAELLSGKRKGV